MPNDQALLPGPLEGQYTAQKSDGGPDQLPATGSPARATFSDRNMPLFEREFARNNGSNCRALYNTAESRQPNIIGAIHRSDDRPRFIRVHYVPNKILFSTWNSSSR